MEHREQVFVGEEIRVGGHQFVDCTFEDCRLLYDGSPGVAFRDCSFSETRLELVDEAGNTISFLQNVYHGLGEGGRAVVDNIFEQVREGRIGAPGPAADNGHEG